MIFADYPGHFVMIILLVTAAGLITAAYSSAQIREKKKRYLSPLLALLKFAAIVILLLILFNPSKTTTSDVYSRNSVLVFFDTSQSMSVADDARNTQITRLDKALEVFSDNLMPDAGDYPEYKIYGFDEQLYHSGSTEYLRRWGSQTNMQKLCEMLIKMRNPDLQNTDSFAGAVVFSDGRADEADIAAYQPMISEDVPVVVVGVGSIEHKADVQLLSVKAPARVFTDCPYMVEVEVASDNLPRKAVTVELLRDALLIDSVQISPEEFIQISSEGQQRKYIKTVEFIAGADTLGRHSLLARLTGIDNEINHANNARSTIVEVVETDKIKILYYAQAANFNVGKLRQVLERDKSVELDFNLDALRPEALSEMAAQKLGYVKLPDTAEQFNEYDIIILGDCYFDQLSGAQVDALYNFVAQRGGGLILLPGRGEYGPADWVNPRAKLLLPVVFSDSDSKLWPPEPDAIELTFEGRENFDYLNLDIEGFEISAFYKIEKTKPAASVIASSAGEPVIILQRLGRGRVCLLNISQMFLLYREDQQGGPLYNLISRLNGYLSQNAAKDSQVELFAERSQSSEDRIKFSAYVCNSSYQPLEQANVLLNYDNRYVSMNPAGGGHYTAELADTTGDAIVATVQAEADGIFLGEKILAMNLPGIKNEMTDTNFNETFLKKLAGQFNGRYFHSDNLDDSVTELFSSQKCIGTHSSIESTWPRWSVLAVLCSILFLEWFIRRSKGLV